MAGEWLNALAQAPNPGASFLNAFQHGQQRREQREMQQRQFKQEDEDRDLRRREMEAKIKESGLEQHRSAIKTGAAIIRQVKPQDQQTWDQALSALQQYGINPDAVGVPRQFDPAYAQQIVQLADALDPQKGAQEPSFVREGDALGVSRDRQRQLWEQKQGIVVINGVPHMAAPRGGDDDEWEYEGGQTPQASGNFRP